MRTPLRLAALACALCAACGAPRWAPIEEFPPPIAAPHRDSGGPLHPLQAAYDVRRYDLALSVDPEARRIDGTLRVQAVVLEPLEELWLDLDRELEVEKVVERAVGGEQALGIWRDQDRLGIALGRPRRPGELLDVTVHYGGRPLEAPRPPWEGGFQWARTPSGEHWIATSCQGEGADLWWPCKDHPSDEPESMGIAVRVPVPLVCASNGRLERVEDHGDGTRTYHWEVSTPINNYGVALAIAPYVMLETELESVAGGTFPVYFWTLPESAERARAFLPEVLEHLRFLERRFGPYPFRGDKYGVAETPHLGMEHQSIIAYGNQFRGGDQGYDWLHFHELAHEWFANLVTAPDWNDFWIHEGFATYAERLYTEELHGRARYHESMDALRGRIRNGRPIAPREPRTSAQMYFVDPQAPAGEREGDGDIYYKGAWVLHSLRHVLGEEPFARFLRRVAYPDPALEARTDGSACRFATTDDVRRIAEEVQGSDLGWFFEVYARRAALPVLEVERAAERAHLRWRAPGGLPFPMPLTVRIGERELRLPMHGGAGSVEVPAGEELALDPDGWVLREL